MVETNTQNTAKTVQKPASNQLQQQVKQAAMLSVGLSFEEKGKLVQKLPELNEEQLRKLLQLFEDEQAHKQKVLGQFFATHPQLYPEFERLSQQHVDTIYSEVEQDELAEEKAKMDQLLQVSY